MYFMEFLLEWLGSPLFVRLALAVVPVGWVPGPKDKTKWLRKATPICFSVKTDRNPLVLKTNMDAGHGGAAGRFDRLDEVALVYSFALKSVGLA